MATRPVYIPQFSGNIYVTTEMVEFEWFAGLAVSQNKVYRSLHQQAKEQLCLNTILEISQVKSKNRLVQS